MFTEGEERFVEWCCVWGAQDDVIQDGDV